MQNPVREALAELVRLYDSGATPFGHSTGGTFKRAVDAARAALALPAPELERELDTCREALRTSRSAIRVYATRNPYTDSVLVWLDVLLEESP